MNSLFGMEIIESPLCELRVSVRKHKKRRNQSMWYHFRIQKKWDKRFGMKLEPVAFMIDGSSAGLPFKKMLVIHPNQMVVIKNLYGNDERPVYH